MLKTIFLLLPLLFSINAIAVDSCTRTSKLRSADDAAKSVFSCGKKENSFLAECDLTTDPIETGHGWLKIKKANWVTHGKNKGIKGPFGFIVCKVK
jgi:hypothetical protein